MAFFKRGSSINGIEPAPERSRFLLLADVTRVHESYKNAIVKITYAS